MATENLEMNGDADRNGETEMCDLAFFQANQVTNRIWSECALTMSDLWTETNVVSLVPLRGRMRRQMDRPLNMNHYANKKSAAESMLDVALLMANASQLKAVMEQGSDFTFYIPLITLISISLILQIIVGVLLIFIVKWNLNDESTHYKLNILENLATAFVFIIVVVNVFITAFGVQRPHQSS